MNLTLFLQGIPSPTGVNPCKTPPTALRVARGPTAFEVARLRHIFITHFLICHSFLDFLYIDDWAVGSPATLDAVGRGLTGDPVSCAHTSKAVGGCLGPLCRRLTHLKGRRPGGSRGTPSPVP
jgi:hypothetical protein